MSFVESQWKGDRKVDGESFSFDVTFKAGQDGQFTGFLTGREQFKISKGIIDSLNNVSFLADLIYEESACKGSWDEANKSIKGTTSDGEFELHLQPPTATPFPSKALLTTGPTLPAQTNPPKDSPSETGLASTSNPAPISQPANSSSATSIPTPAPGHVVWTPYQGTWNGTCFKGCSAECRGDFKSDESGKFTFNYFLEGDENDRETVHGVMEICGEEIKGTGTIDGTDTTVTFVMARSNGDMTFVRVAVTKTWTNKAAAAPSIKPSAVPNDPSRLPEYSSLPSPGVSLGQSPSYLDLIKALFGSDTKPRTFKDWEEAATLRTEDLKANGSPSPLIWVLVKGKNIPANAIVGGMEKHQPLYIARAFYEGELCIGKAGRQLEKGAAIPYNGHEVPVDTYEVLVPAMEPAIRYKYSETLYMPAIPRTTLKPDTKPDRPQEASVGAPEELKSLETIKTIVMIDDSLSMNGQLWQDAREAVAGVVDSNSKVSSDGVDIFFMNNPRNEINVKGADVVRSLFDCVKPSGETPLGSKLQELFVRYLPLVEDSNNRHRPIVLVVITDGEPTDEPEGIIVEAARRLDKNQVPLMQFILRFIQIGDDPDATDFLKILDEKLSVQYKCRDIVQSTLFNSNDQFSAKKVLNVLTSACD